MYYYDGNIYVEDEDQCQTCTYFAQGVACPLLQALGMGLVVMQDNLMVTSCGFYQEFKRQLRLIKAEDQGNNNNDHPSGNKHSGKKRAK